MKEKSAFFKGWVVGFLKWIGGAIEDQKGHVSGKRIAGYVALYIVADMAKRGFIVPEGQNIIVVIEMFYAVLGFAGLCFGLAMMEWFAMIKENKNKSNNENQ